MPELVGPDLDERVLYLWHLFIQVNNATGGQIGPTQIKDHAALAGIKINRFEYRALLAMNIERATNE